MPEWLLKYILPYAIQLATPFIVAGARKLAEIIGKQVPPKMLPVFASVIGEAMNLVAGAPLPYGIGGAAGIGLRELYDQLYGKDHPRVGI